MGGCNKEYKVMVQRGVKWQAPGKSRLFDSTIDVPMKIIKSDISKDNIISTPLTLTTLRFIKECNDKNIPCTDKYIKSNLSEYLVKNIENYQPNNAYLMHNVKNPLFYGLVEEIPVDKQTTKYILTVDGRKFLTSIDNKNYIEAMEWFILNLLSVKYPGNKAVKRTPTPNLYPFRVLFYLFNKYKSLSKDDLENWIPYICFKEHLDKQTFKNLNGCSYSKWNSWVMSCLWKLKIIKKSGKNYEIDNSVYPISEMIKRTNYIDDPDLLFYDQQTMVNKIGTKSRKYFTEKVKTRIKEMYEWKCWIDSTHIVVKTGKENKPNLEVHHIIPCEFEKSFPELADFNCDDNLVPLCHNCHMIIHHGSDLLERKQIVDLIWSRKKDFLLKHIASKDELLSLYMRL